MNKRYSRNIGTITIEEQNALAQKAVCVIGCGGLGGGVIENLARMGVGKLTVVDGDVFDETNLNRQVFSKEGNLGKGKAEEVASQIKEINSEIVIKPVSSLLCENNAESIISGHDIVVDALDNVEARLILEDACEKLNVPLVHGAISGWTGQVAVVMPGSHIMEKLYKESEHHEEIATNPSFTPAVISAMQAAETIKVLLGKEDALMNKLLIIDLLNHDYEVIMF